MSSACASWRVFTPRSLRISFVSCMRMSRSGSFIARHCSIVLCWVFKRCHAAGSKSSPPCSGCDKNGADETCSGSLKAYFRTWVHMLFMVLSSE